MQNMKRYQKYIPCIIRLFQSRNDFSKLLLNL